jgi:hypothetical protein
MSQIDDCAPVTASQVALVPVRAGSRWRREGLGADPESPTYIEAGHEQS